MRGDTVYEWLPTSIVAGTFLLGLLSEAYESGRLSRWAERRRLTPPWRV